MLNKVSIHAESPHPVSAMPKRPSPFEGEGQEGEVRHPQPVMLSAVKHPHWIPRYARNDIACYAERSVAQ